MNILSFCKNLLRRNHTFVSRSSIQWFGTEYGGFYVDKSLLVSPIVLFSFGVGEDLSFDLAISELSAARIYLFDPTPKSIDFVANMNLPANFHFYPIGISDLDEKATFYLPKNDEHVSGSLLIHGQLDLKKKIDVQLKRLSTILNELNIQQVDVLKMDVEGSEYKILKNLIQEGIFPTQICVEFHNSFFRNGEQLFAETVESLKAYGYNIGAISKSGKEFLFIRGK